MADDQVRARRTSKAGGATPAKRTAAKKAAAKTATPAKKTAAAKKVVPAKKTVPAKKVTPTRKSVPAKKTAAAKKQPAKKQPVKKQPTEKAAAAKRPTTRRTGAVLSGAEQTERRSRLRQGVSYAGDWEKAPVAPEPEPVREDPHARIRGILRAAAASLEAREEGARPAAPPPVAPAPAPPPEPEEPVTRVLVAPVTPEDEVEEEEEWLPPEVIEEEDSAPPPPPPPAPSPPPPPPPSPPPSAPAPPEAPPVPPPSAPPAPEERKAGAGLSIVAILLALVVPLIGAILGLVLSGRGKARGAGLAGVARVVSILALVAYLVGGGVFAYYALRDEGVDYSKLKVGDCFDSASSNEVRGVKVKPCDEPHDSEIFFLVEHPAGPDEPYPGKDTLVQFAADACLGQPLTDYLGIPLEQSSLKDFEIVPQESAWEGGRRLLVCGLDTGGEGRITGSVKGTRR